MRTLFAIASAAATLLGVAYYLDKSEKEAEHQMKSDLRRQKKQYQQEILKQHEYTNRAKRIALFKHLKKQQTLLKKERRQLAKIRDTASSKQERYKTIRQMQVIQKQIDDLQRQADKIRL